MGGLESGFQQLQLVGFPQIDMGFLAIRMAIHQTGQLKSGLPKGFDHLFAHFKCGLTDGGTDGCLQSGWISLILLLHLLYTTLGNPQDRSSPTGMDGSNDLSVGCI